jgi:hypothetical protein
MNKATMITNVLAGIAVTDMEAAVPWYERLLGRAPDARPMPEVAEWQFAKGGWLQVFVDRARAGHGSVTLVESSLDDRTSDLRAKSIEIRRATDTDSVRTALVEDPDGNHLVFAQAVGGRIESSSP